jgi:D-alanyl-lipoteichoic acid acyltransferase DltB (MBOAT superfamily)
MLFNSYEFILGFLPATALVFFALGAVSRTWALRWLIFASLFFYAWWRPVNLLIIAPAILINFFLARLLQRLNRAEKRTSSRAVLALGIAFNVAFLGYFKYANFGVSVVNDLAGTAFLVEAVVLPLGISFITFQKIAFLVDVHARRVESFSLHDYALFVLFFPQLIAGPIVHYREMMPQFKVVSCRPDAEGLAVGLTLFVVGLFKKVVLADGIAPYVASIYDQAAAGGEVGLLAAWMGALGFTLQIYFDFSGYSDMALGIARLFGVRLPPNFNSPLRACSIIDFWLRWHMTLTRFLTAYLYNPLALWATRRRLARGLGGIGTKVSIGAFVQVLMIPTLLTMFISGVWHGAGYTFLLWGVLHGGFLTLNHVWRLLAPRLWRDRDSYTRVMRPVGFALTLICVVVSMVVFRAPTVETAASLLQGMVGSNGVDLPLALDARPIESGRWLHLASLGHALGLDTNATLMALWIVLLSTIAFALPNSLQLLAQYGPALGWTAANAVASRGKPIIAWRPSIAWALIVSALGGLAVVYLSGPSEFLYWQF